MRIRAKALRAIVLYTLSLICAKRFAREHGIDLKTALSYISNGAEYKVLLSKNWLKLLPKGIELNRLALALRGIKCYKRLSRKWTREVDCKCVSHMLKREYGISPVEIMMLEEAEKAIQRINSGEEGE